MNEEQELEQATIVTPGQLLKQAREKMQLSTAQVALRLNLREHIIDDIEADIYDGKISLTFTKGYLKTYAKLVKVSEAEVLEAFEQVNRASKEPAKLQSFSRRVARQASDDRLMLVTYAIVIILVALSVMWWFQQSDDVAPAKLSNSSSSVAANVSADKPQNEPSNTSSQPQVVEQQQTESANNQSADISVTEPQDREQPVADNKADETSENPQTAGDDADTEETDAASSPQQDEQQTAVEDSAGQVEEQPRVQHFTATEARDFADPIPLVFEFSEDCWVSIIDATGKTLAVGVKVQGYVMPVSGIPPFEVTLGVPKAVKVSYAGEEVDISRFPNTRTARFNLPLEN